MKPSPEEKAEERYKFVDEATNKRHDDFNDRQVERRIVYATCIREQVEPLEAWKESAINVLGEWDKVHEALGKPGKLGESMAEASLLEVQKLRALVQVLGDAFTLADNGQTETDGTKQASGHAHRIHAVWDMDNRKELAGMPCAKCLAFDEARNALKEAGFTPTTDEVR